MERNRRRVAFGRSVSFERFSRFILPFFAITSSMLIVRTTPLILFFSSLLSFTFQSALEIVFCVVEADVFDDLSNLLLIIIDLSVFRVLMS